MSEEEIERCPKCGKQECAGHEEPSVTPRGRGSARAAERRAARAERRALLGVPTADTSEFPINVEEV